MLKHLREVLIYVRQVVVGRHRYSTQLLLKILGLSQLLCLQASHALHQLIKLTPMNGLDLELFFFKLLP